MKILPLIALLLTTSCASRPIPRVVMETPPPAALEPLVAVRHAELLRVYHVGRYVDTSGVMHEQHPVYRVEAESRWNLRPGATGSAPISLQDPPMDAAYAPAPTNDVVLAELNRQKDATERVMREATQFARSSDQLQDVTREMTAVAKNHILINTRLVQTEGRLVQLEHQLQQLVGPITPGTNEVPTIWVDVPETPNP